MDSSSPRRFVLFDRFFSYLDHLRPFDRLLLSLILIIFATSAIWSLYIFSSNQLISVPTKGGTLVEGIVGSPRFINPVLAVTRADHDLVGLTYSGLLKLSPDGELINDLAENVTVSDDGVVYNVTLRQDRYWHDGTPVTADDVAFTISLIQDPSIKSPLRGNWSGVSVEYISEYEINFVLSETYTPFKENLTVGILPKHIWKDLSAEELPFSQHNVSPVGNGPYEVTEIKRNSTGLASQYHLAVSEKYPEPVEIPSLVVKFYNNEKSVLEAWKKGEINATAALGENSLSNLSPESYHSVSEPLPRVFAIFFNQNKTPVLRDQAAREALDAALDREELIKRAAKGYARVTNTALPAEWVPATSTETNNHLEEARAILKDGGWKQTDSGRWEKEIDDINVPLALTIRSANGALFENASSYITETWHSLGVEVNTELYEQSDLTQTVIRPRDYQALLFGIDTGRSLDVYPFWHSSQREDPGLNVSLYANISVDRLTEEIRTSTSAEEKELSLINFATEVNKETPAIFLFSPTFEYILRPGINTTQMKRISRASERFSNLNDWYINRSNVWPIFANNDNEIEESN